MQQGPCEECRRVATSAEKCTRNCDCLKENGKPQCIITESLNGKVLFSENRKKCSYQVPFGSTFTCTCPVRHEAKLKK